MQSVRDCTLWRNLREDRDLLYEGIETETWNLRVSPKAFFSSTKTQKHTFPAQKKGYLFLFLCKVSSPGGGCT